VPSSPLAPLRPRDAAERLSARGDARCFVRAWGPETLELLDAPTEEEAVDALLALRIPQFTTRSATTTGSPRAEEYAAALARQQVPGFTASLRLTLVLVLLLLAGACAALVVAWSTLGPWTTLRLLAPERFGLLVTFEVLMIAPIALVPLHLLLLAGVHWRARTHGRAVLRVARLDTALRRAGIPRESPVTGIAACWHFLLGSFQCLLLGYGAFVIMCLLVVDRPVLEGPIPVALAYAAPTLAIMLLALWRTRLWTRRAELLTALLYRP
jgi:hypothetical protein